MFRAARAFLVTALVLAVAAGCGWIAASGRPAGKPDAFVLRGHVAVPVAAGDTRPDGAACAATVPGVVAGGPVRDYPPPGVASSTTELQTEPSGRLEGPPFERGMTWSTVSCDLDPQYWQVQLSRANTARRVILRRWVSRGMRT